MKDDEPGKRGADCTKQSSQQGVACLLHNPIISANVAFASSSSSQYPYLSHVLVMGEETEARRSEVTGPHSHRYKHRDGCHSCTPDHLAGLPGRTVSTPNLQGISGF